MSGSYLHRIKFDTKDGLTRIMLDDFEVHGCTAAAFDYEVNQMPQVILRISATDVEVNADTAFVMNKEDK